jgi:UMF1 family MFS transporter
LAIVGGMFTFGFIEELTGNMRNSALMLCVFFFIGLVLLISLHKQEQKLNSSKP